MSRKWRRITLGALVLSVIGAVRAPAGAVLVTSKNALAPADSIDWGRLGPDSTSLPSTTAVTSPNGLSATASTGDPTGLVRVDEGLSWVGNFTSGDHLISNVTFSSYPLTLEFANPVRGAGAQIQLDRNGPFTATIQAFSGNTSLGTFAEDGLSTTSQDGSAIFIGVLDSRAEITSIVFGMEAPPTFQGDFALSSLLINTSGTVPEPPSLVLAAIAFAAGIGLWLRRRVDEFAGGRNGPVRRVPRRDEPRSPRRLPCRTMS